MPGSLQPRPSCTTSRCSAPRDEAPEPEFYDRVEKLVHDRGTVETTMARLRGAAEDAAGAIWWLAGRVEELESGRGGARRG